MGLVGRNEDERAGADALAAIAALERGATVNDVIKLVFFVGSLVVPGARRENVQARAQRRYAKELQPWFAGTALLGKQRVEFEEGPVGHVTPELG